MKIQDVEQGTEAWHNIRVGRPTASQFSRIITAARGDLSKSWKGYAIELIAECFVPFVSDFTGNKWTDRGMELEPLAREAFALRTGFDVRKVGFITRDDGVAGCSPDGLIYDADGKIVAGLEIKCPMPKTHVEYLCEGTLPDDYKAQIHGGLAVTGLDEWHFWSWHEGMKPLHIVVGRDAYTEKVSVALDQFITDYAALRKQVIPKVQIETKPE